MTPIDVKGKKYPETFAQILDYVMGNEVPNNNNQTDSNAPLSLEACNYALPKCCMSWLEEGDADICQTPNELNHKVVTEKTVLPSLYLCRNISLAIGCATCVSSSAMRTHLSQLMTSLLPADACSFNSSKTVQLFSLFDWEWSVVESNESRGSEAGGNVYVQKKY